MSTKSREWQSRMMAIYYYISIGQRNLFKSFKNRRRKREKKQAKWEYIEKKGIKWKKREITCSMREGIHMAKMWHNVNLVGGILCRNQKSHDAGRKLCSSVSIPLQVHLEQINLVFYPFYIRRQVLQEYEVLLELSCWAWVCVC